MFLGQYQHSLDYKGRTSVPKKFREDLKPSAILTVGLEGCLFLYPKDEWEKLSTRLSELPLTASDARNFSRYLFSSAVEVSFDKLGRITIPDYLKNHASLKKRLIIAGVLNRVEIWDQVKWEVFNKNLNSQSEEIAEKLSGSGI